MVATVLATKAPRDSNPVPLSPGSQKLAGEVKEAEAMFTLVAEKKPQAPIGSLKLIFNSRPSDEEIDKVSVPQSRMEYG